jgi:uroporphyrinogen decarboxylase
MGMVAHEINKEFGGDVAFNCGIDVQQLLPLATPSKVKEEVKYLLDSMGKDGGYVDGPAYNIHVGTPPEDVVAMEEAVDEYYG